MQPVQTDAAVFQSTKQGMLQSTHTQPNTIALPDAQLDVAIDREIALIDGVVSLLGTAVLCLGAVALGDRSAATIPDRSRRSE